MAPDASLSHHFLARLKADLRSRVSASAELEQRLARLVSSGQQAWPGISISPREFVSYLAEKASIAADPTSTELLPNQVEELYLACACARGDSVAIAEFDRSYMREAEIALAHMKLASALVDEVKQTLRQRLFVAAEGERPKIAEYAGRGGLRALVRVAAVRLALNLVRKAGAEVTIEGDHSPDLASPIADPELLLIKQSNRAAFKTAFESALQSLSSRERNLLRHQLIDELSIDQIGVVYGVHRATAARWLAAAKEKVAAHARKQLLRTLGVGREEADSMAKLAQSQLDLSISRILKEDDAPAARAAR